MSARKILLVEGTDDEHVLKHLCGNRGIPRLDEIRPQGSVEKLLENLPVRLKESDVEVLGVVLDADTDVAARWRSLRDRLAQAGYENVPLDPDPEGTILEPSTGTLLPCVGVWMMPDNQAPGILEDFAQRLVPEGSMLFAHVHSSVASIPEGERRFRDLDLPKAIIHTWLAWQKNPGTPMGLAIKEGYLDPDAAQACALASWLSRLFLA